MRDIGTRLADEMQALGVSYSQFNDVVDIPYRDDNCYMWEFEDIREAGRVIAGVTTQQIRKYVSVMEMINTLDVPGAGDNANEIWVLASEFFRDEETTSLNQQEGREPPPHPYH